MSEIDLNIGLNECIWTKEFLFTAYDESQWMYKTSCGVERTLDVAIQDQAGNYYCPKCGKQIRVE